MLSSAIRCKSYFLEVNKKKALGNDNNFRPASVFFFAFRGSSGSPRKLYIKTYKQKKLAAYFNKF